MDDKSVGSSAPEGEISPIQAPPAFPYNNKAGLAKMNAGKPLAALNGDASSLIERLNDGETAAQVAQSLGITNAALYAWMLEHCPEQWRAASAAQSLVRLEKAEGELNDAELTPDKVDVARSSASARLAQWSLERTFPKIYADSKADAGGVTVQVLIARDGESAVIVQGNPA